MFNAPFFLLEKSGQGRTIMKIFKVTLPASLAFVLITVSSERASAQFLVGEVIKATVTKVIKAIDLKVQRMQNQTIWLQNAQKVLENQLSRLRLSEIGDWSERQKQLYSNYYTELWKVKSVISYYQRIKDLTVKQAMLVKEYQQAWSIFRQDPHFSAGEIMKMQAVYSGLLKASVENLDQIMLVVSPGKTQMSDEERMTLISKAGDRLDENYDDLRRFNNENIMLSISRSKDLKDTQQLKALYGIH